MYYMGPEGFEFVSYQVSLATSHDTEVKSLVL